MSNDIEISNLPPRRGIDYKDVCNKMLDVENAPPKLRRKFSRHLLVVEEPVEQLAPIMYTPRQSPNKKRIPMKGTNISLEEEDVDMRPEDGTAADDDNTDFSIIPGDQLIIHDVPRNRKKTLAISLVEAKTSLQKALDDFHDNLRPEDKVDCARLLVKGPERDVGNNYLYAIAHPDTPGINLGPVPERLAPYVNDFNVKPYIIQWNGTTRGKDKQNRILLKDLNADHKDGIKAEKKRDEIMKMLTKKGFAGLTGHFAFRGGLGISCETLALAYQHAETPFPQHPQLKFSISKPSQLEVRSYGQITLLGNAQGYVIQTVKRYFDRNLTDLEGNRYSFHVFKDEHADAIHIWTGDANLSKAALTREFHEEFQLALSGHNLRGPDLTYRLNEGGGFFKTERTFYKNFEKKVDKAAGVMTGRIESNENLIRNLNMRLTFTEENQREMATRLFDHERSIMNLNAQQSMINFRVESHRQQGDLTLRQSNLMNSLSYLQLQLKMDHHTEEEKQQIKEELKLKSREYQETSAKLEQEIEGSRFILEQEESSLQLQHQQMVSPPKPRGRIEQATEEISDDDMDRAEPVNEEEDTQPLFPIDPQQEAMRYRYDQEDCELSLEPQRERERSGEDLTDKTGDVDEEAMTEETNENEGNTGSKGKEKPKRRTQAERKSRSGTNSKEILVGTNLKVPIGNRGRRDASHPYSPSASSMSGSRRSSRKQSPATKTRSLSDLSDLGDDFEKVARKEDGSLEIVPDSQEVNGRSYELDSGTANVDDRAESVSTYREELNDSSAKSNTLCPRLNTGKARSAVGGKWTLLLLLFLNLFVQISAMPLSCQSLCTFAINANGMGFTAKIDAISKVIHDRKPHVFVVSETKNKSNVGNKLGLKGYQIFESPGIKSTSRAEDEDGNRGQGRIDKWGIILGVSNDIQLYNYKIKVPPDLKGRVATVDILLSTQGGRGIRHRVIAAYAPAKINADEQTRKFWRSVSTLCETAPGSWSLIGDLNATIASYEGKSTDRENRLAYIKFLRDNDGTDLWAGVTNRSYRTHNTTNPRGEGEGGQILDRVAVKGGIGTEGDIRVLKDFISGTDHRPIWANLIISDGREENPITEVEEEGNLRVPRIRYPAKTEKNKFEEFEKEANSWIEGNRELDRDIDTDEQFIETYRRLSELMTVKAAEVFGTMKKMPGRTFELPRNEESDRKTCQARALGRYQKKIRNPRIEIGHDDERTINKIRKEYEKETKGKTWEEHIQFTKKALYKRTFQIRANLAFERAAKIEGAKIYRALKGGSAKTLMCGETYINAPLAVNPLKNRSGIEPNENEIVSNPDEVKDITTQYFTNLYKPDKEHAMQKPWMETPEITKIRKEVEKDPFVWPQKINTDEFRAILRTGNPRPAPGPDGWEKWVVKNLPEEIMRIVVRCHNFITKHNRFPGEITDMILCIIYKKGITTNLMNWRGVMLSNFLSGTPLTHLNIKLIRYATDKGIIPNTQVATQKGVQARDLTSLLAGMKTWAHRNNETIYVVKRDQMKGFDFLSPKGFHDAIIAYGLPKSIIDLDEASLRENRCFPRTAYGRASPFIIKGLTKQGGALSPLKSTFTTSMGHRWINDMMRNDPDALIIRTDLGMKEEPHTEGDEGTILLNEVECMDDTLIMAKTMESVRRATLRKETFQFAYGWLTSWPKTQAFVINPKADTPSHIELESISPENLENPLEISTHKIELTKNRLEFMRVWIDEPETRLAEIEEYIETFKFPTFTRKTPITMARKLVKQIMLAKIRAMINLQPLSPEGADKADKLISARIHDMMKMPYRPSTDIMTLPVKLGGIDFPSVKRMNAGIALEGLRRDLNHHVEIYRDMAKITLAEWTCKLNGCKNPLVTQDSKPKKTPKNALQQSWRSAKLTMHETGIEIYKTENLYWTKGEVSVEHILNATKDKKNNEADQNKKKTFDKTLLKRIGIKKTKDIGRWERNRDGFWKWKKKTIEEHEKDRAKKTTQPQKKAWERIQETMEDLRPHKIFGGKANSMTKRETRRREANEWIKSRAVEYKPREKPENIETRDWGSDGSVRPANAGWNEPRTISTAVVGRKTLQLKSNEISTSILQGEVIGLIGQTILAGEFEGPRRGITDHLNSQRLIKDITTFADPETKIRGMNGRSYYRWLIKCIAENPIEFVHVKSHTGRRDDDSKINEEADQLAGKTHDNRNIVMMPAPTFEMDDFSVYKKGMGWIESNCKELVENILQQKTSDRLKDNPRMARYLYDEAEHPSYPYTHAPSAYAATVQLYARSGQLPFKSEMKRRGYTEDESCIFGCNQPETADHIFTQCGQYTHWREETQKKLEGEITKKMEGEEWNEEERTAIKEIIEKSFTDDANIWPLIQSAYFLGHVPNLKKALQDNEGDRNKRSTIHNSLHMAYIRLAARIMGNYQKEAARREGF